MAALLNGVIFCVGAVAMVGTPQLLGIARFQPLRSFHLIYIRMFLLPVNLAARRLFQQRPVLLGLSLMCVCGVMFIVERQTYPASPRVEWPWGQSDNPWRQAFDWVRSSTPKDAVFALAPDYMDEPLGRQPWVSCLRRTRVIGGSLHRWRSDYGFPSIGAGVVHSNRRYRKARRNAKQ
jgi:hypothetical protein